MRRRTGAARAHAVSLSSAAAGGAARRRIWRMQNPLCDAAGCAARLVRDEAGMLCPVCGARPGEEPPAA
jgi:hypothetical protein